MRVISGSARGLKLKTPQGLNTRPTTDRIKESLFNIINPYLQEAIFLDLFSGSGAIGIEALSRGATKCFFVDNSKESFDIINQNLQASRLFKKAEVYKLDCLSFIEKISIEKISNEKLQFDVIFIDPPYSKGFIEPIIKKIKQADILKDDGIIICEQHIDDEICYVDGLNNYRVKEYKITKMVFFQII